MIQSWIVITPPLLVLLIAITTKSVIYGLAAGIVLAALIATHGMPHESISLIIKSFLQETRISDLLVQSGNYDHAYTFGFLILLGILIQLITKTGGMSSLTTLIHQQLKSRRGAQTTSLLLSLVFFIDDYLNSITIGSIMRPITDAFKIPRAKLAFLIDSISAPLCMIVPISSWVAFIAMVMQSSGISLLPDNNPIFLNDPFTVYIKTIPYILYPIFIIFSAWLIVTNRLSFGAMARHNEIAATTGNLFGGGSPFNEEKLIINTQNHNSYALRNFIVPMMLFLTLIPAIILYTGWKSNTPWYTPFKNADTILFSLFYASLIACIFAMVFFLVKKHINYTHIPQTIIDGFNLFRTPILTLLLAWMLSSLLKNNLDTGGYLAKIFIGAAPLYILPLVFFVTAFIMTTSTGSSWGTFSILIPVGIPLLGSIASITGATNITDVPLLLPTLGALLSGGIAGSHFSPLADSTIMAASSAQCNLLDHTQTQIGYSTPALISSIICFGLFGLCGSSPCSTYIILLTGLCCTAVLLSLRSWIHKRKNPRTKQ